MVSKPRPQTTGNKTARAATSRGAKEQGVVLSALVVNAPDLSLHTSLQNILSYAVECVTGLHEQSSQRSLLLVHFARCLDRLETILKDAITLSHQSRLLLTQFLDDGKQLKTFVEEQLRPGGGENLSSSAAAVLAGKTFNLQWTAICLADELRSELSDPDRA